MATTLFVMRRLAFEEGGRTFFVGVGKTPEEAAGYSRLSGGNPEQGVNFEVLRALPLNEKTGSYGSLGEVIDRMQALLALLGDAHVEWEDFINDFAKLVCNATLGQ